MHFVGSNAWFSVLLVVHVISAIAGIGPAFAFGLLGPLAQRSGPEGAPAVLDGIVLIESKMLLPAVRYVQWTTGVLLIFNRGLNREFFSTHRIWLIAAIVIYLLVWLGGEFRNGPIVHRMAQLAKEKQFGPEFQTLAARIQKTGPLFAIGMLTIIVLMVWKPGSGCPALRC